MINTKDLSKDIKRYYEISVFINKYISLITAFLLSVIIILFSSVQSTNILAYSSTDINTNTLKFSKNLLTNIWVNVSSFNNKSKNIKAIVVFTKSTVKDWKVNLWYWAFRDKNGIYFPSNLSIDQEKYNKFILSGKQLGFSYITLFKVADKYETKWNIPKLKKESDSKIQKMYNLACLDTFMSDTPFCNYNKYKLISDLYKKPSLEISKKMYNAIISSLDIEPEEKCRIATSIFFKKYNYNKLIDIIEENCDDTTASRLKIASNLLEVLPDDKLFTIKKEYNSSIVYLTQLMNQTSYIVRKDTLPWEVILSYVTLINKWIQKNYITPNIAEILIYTLKKYVIDKVDVNNKALQENIETLLNGDEALGTKWLISFVSNKNVIKEIDLITDDTDIIRSKREVFKNIVKANFKNELVLTDKVSLINRNKVLKVRADLLLVYKDSNKIVTKKVPVKFYVTKLKDVTFNVENLSILDPKIKEYLWDIPNDYEDFEEMHSFLKEKLYAPLVKWDWSKSSDDKLSVCDRLKTVSGWAECNDWVVTLKVKSLGYDGNLSFNIKVNENLKVTGLSLSKWPNYIELNNMLEEKIPVNTTLLLKFIKLGYKKLDKKTYNAVVAMLKKIINIYVNREIKKRVWLQWDALDKLELRFKKSLGAEIDLVRKIRSWLYKVYFTVWKLKLVAEYNYSKNTIEKLAILNKKDLENNFVCSWLTLNLSATNSEILNWFKANPLEFLKNKCPGTVEQYLRAINKIK